MAMNLSRSRYQPKIIISSLLFYVGLKAFEILPGLKFS